MCAACRALIPAAARICPECGHSPGPRVSQGVARVIEGMMPGFVSVSSGILTANVLLYALSLFVWTHIHDVLPSNAQGAAWNVALIAMGGNVPALVAEGEVWRLLTSVFLHGGLLHILFNSWALLTVGPLVEELYGARRFVVLYVVTGGCASLASALWRAGSWGPGIGASGALVGLIGVAAVWGWRRGGSLGEGIKGQMVQWAIYVLVLGFLFRFDNAAHIGGMVSGAFLGLVLGDRGSSRAKTEPLWEVAAWVCGLACVGCFLMVGLGYDATLSRIFQGLP